MQLHELKRANHRRKAVRVGRGGKRGTTSGRGQKGQKSRAGRRIRPALRDLITRLPKKRGFRNKPLSQKPFSFDVKKLSKFSESITLPFLKEKGIVPRRWQGKVKVIGNGKLEKPLVLKGIVVSKGAKEAIEKAGGTVAE